MVATRILGWVMYRGYVIVPAVAALIWAILRRNPYVIAGYAAFLPWTLAHLVAARDLVGALPSYYAFPYMLASFWPLIGFMLLRRAGGRARLAPRTGRRICPVDGCVVRAVAVRAQSDADGPAGGLPVAAVACSPEGDR
jgi:hypothetical protein